MPRGIGPVKGEQMITSRLLRRTHIAGTEWSLWVTTCGASAVYEVRAERDGGFERRSLGQVGLVAVAAFEQYMVDLRERAKA